MELLDIIFVCELELSIVLPNFPNRSSFAAYGIGILLGILGGLFENMSFGGRIYSEPMPEPM